MKIINENYKTLKYFSKSDHLEMNEHSHEYSSIFIKRKKYKSTAASLSQPSRTAAT